MVIRTRFGLMKYLCVCLLKKLKYVRKESRSFQACLTMDNYRGFTWQASGAQPQWGHLQWRIQVTLHHPVPLRFASLAWESPLLDLFTSDLWWRSKVIFRCLCWGLFMPGGAKLNPPFPTLAQYPVLFCSWSFPLALPNPNIVGSFHLGFPQQWDHPTSGWSTDQDPCLALSTFSDHSEWQRLNSCFWFVAVISYSATQQVISLFPTTS